jgi:hypothetical protein
MKTIHDDQKHGRSILGDYFFDVTEFASARVLTFQTLRKQAARDLKRLTAEENNDLDSAALAVVVVLLLKTVGRRRAVASGCCRHSRTAVSSW